MDTHYDICIIGGLGHIGLPLGIAFAKAGRRVMLYDINADIAAQVMRGSMPFAEEHAEERLKEVLGKTLFISLDKQVITQSHFVVIVIGTPIDEHLNPSFTLFRDFIDDIVGYIEDGQHIVLRSTVYPGITEKISRYFAARNKKVKLSFCPERIAEGKALVELYTLPQIVSAFDPESRAEARELFSAFTGDIIDLEPVEAELAKLFTNSWRYLQFSISNYFYQISTQYGIDFYKIFDAIRYKYPRAQNFPAPGFAAGPCLLKDTMQLVSFSNNNFFLGHAAMLVNEGLPNFIVARLKERHNLAEKTVGILGMAFKADSDDKRESLSYKLKKLLIAEADTVYCTDVYIREEGFVTPEQLIEASDIIVVATPHREYKELRIPIGTVVVDVWNYYGNGGMF